MTLDVKVNALEKRISQLFKVTFFSERPKALTDPFYADKYLKDLFMTSCMRVAKGLCPAEARKISWLLKQLMTVAVVSSILRAS